MATLTTKKNSAHQLCKRCSTSKHVFVLKYEYVIKVVSILEFFLIQFLLLIGTAFWNYVYTFTFELTKTSVSIGHKHMMHVHTYIHMLNLT